MTHDRVATHPDKADFVEDYLLYMLAAASEQASAQFHERARKAGLRVPEWRVLACLHDYDGAMITRLAGFALIEQSRLTRIIAQMESRGLVLRKNDPRDGRRVRVYLAQEGRALVSKLVPEARAHEARLLAKLSNDDGAKLKTTLHALLAALEKDDCGDN